jgi:hypothetical protein
MYGKFQKNALAPIDELQLKLTEQYITPHVDNFEKAFYALREMIDEAWLAGDTNKVEGERKLFLLDQIKKQRQKLGASHSITYPLGRCYNITKIAFAYLNKFELDDEQSVFYPLSDFVRQGGVFKIIWGEVRHEVFQTSMQMGNWYFDTANDTVFIEKPKVLKFTFDSPLCEFHEIKSVQQYIDIKREYHQCEIYINTLFPAINQLFPLIIFRAGKISIDDSRHVADIMVHSKYSFLSQNTLEELPIELLNVHRAKVLGNKNASYIASWLGDTSKELNQLNAKEVYKVVKQINFLLKSPNY